jgi:hypothetical protein
MAIRPVCDSCSEELNEFGARLLDPPDKKSQLKKLHLCAGCYEDILGNFKNS